MRSWGQWGRQRWFFAGLVCILWLLATTIVNVPIASAGIKSVLEGIAKATKKSGNDVLQRTASILDELGSHTEESLLKANDLLKAKPSSVDEVVDALRKAGIQDADSFRKALGEIDDVQRGLLKELFITSRQVVERADALGRGVDEVVSVARHPDGLPLLRMMQDDDAFKAVLDGQKRFGDAFVDFAKQVDQAGVVEASRRFDELEELRKVAPDKFDDVIIALLNSN